MILQLFDLVIEPPNFRLFKFDPAPFCRVGFRERLDDFDNFDAGGHALFAELQEAFMRRGARFGGVLENAVFAAASARGNTAAARMMFPVAAALQALADAGTAAGLWRSRAVQPAQYFRHHISN